MSLASVQVEIIYRNGSLNCAVTNLMASSQRMKYLKESRHHKFTPRLCFKTTFYLLQIQKVVLHISSADSLVAVLMAAQVHLEVCLVVRL